jgi:hypothetical protein
MLLYLCIFSNLKPGTIGEDHISNGNTYINNIMLNTDNIKYAEMP